MATGQEILLVRRQIDDNNIESYTFSNQIIRAYIDEKSSINYASYMLLDILIIQLRKQLLEDDETGTERNKFATVTARKNLLESQRDKYKEAYNEESGGGSGRFIATTRPTIAGGDV